MSGPTTHPTADATAPGTAAGPGSAGTGGGGRARGRWMRDLAMGVRFAVHGGREGWTRTVLTAIGVGLGVALLLVTTSLPTALAQRHDRERARNDMTYSSVVTAPGDDTLLLAVTDTTYRGQEVRGRLLRPEGAEAPLPPGVRSFPRPGEMVASPALRALLSSDEGRLLRERLPYRISGAVGSAGLIAPGELVYYAGSSTLRYEKNSPGRIERVHAFGSTNQQEEGLDPVLLLLVLIVFVVLLMPVGVFVAAAVRFGGERRDRRLAALRLVGADGRMTRRIAAGEALAGSLLGLVLGAGFFLVARQLAGRVEVLNVGVFPADLRPTPVLIALVAVAVPVAAVVVTLLALRGVVIEPLGVVRTAKPPRRRLWWRLLLPLAGLGLLSPMVGQGADNGNFNEVLVISGTVLLLIGVTALLPWVVESVVAGLGGGAVSWQLAVRRLQLSSGTAARMVNGVAVAVAGAIALQMLFAGVADDYTRSTGNDVDRAQMIVSTPPDVPVTGTAARLDRTRGVQHTVAVSTGSLGERTKDPEHYVQVTVGTCAALREVSRVPHCRDGDTFVVRGAEYDNGTLRAAKPGRTLILDPTYGKMRGREFRWRLPDTLGTAGARADATGFRRGGILVTPGALPAGAASSLTGNVFVRLDPGRADARELVRNAVARISPLAPVDMLVASERSLRFASIRTGLFVGAACVLALVGASLLVSQLEQLRERRKLLSALVAFGTRRRTLGLSVLWQTAVPIALGLLLAAVVGLTLGTVLLRMVGATFRVDWSGVLMMAGAGAGVVLLVTALSLPPLVRMMRPEGLRTE